MPWLGTPGHLRRSAGFLLALIRPDRVSSISVAERILLSYSGILSIYTWVSILAPSLFLISYLACLSAQARRGPDGAESAVDLPLWMNFVYPSWLDRLTLRGIVRAFFHALGMTLMLFTILAVVFLLIAGKLLVR